MNISIKNFDKNKLLNEIISYSDKIKDPNLKIKFIRDLYCDLDEISSKLRKTFDKLDRSLEKNRELVECPSCHLYNNREILCKQAEKNGYVDGQFHESIDEGPFDGWSHKDYDMKLMWAKCKYCGKKIYCASPISIYGMSYFLGKVNNRPHFSNMM